MSKTIVICCDGTGNQINDRLSNVLKFYRVVQKTDDQLVYYSPGVGTVGDYDSSQLVKQRVKEFLGLATGYGLDDNVLDAYRSLGSEQWWGVTLKDGLESEAGTKAGDARGRGQPLS